MYRLLLTEAQAETLRAVLDEALLDGQEEIRKAQHPDDKAGYHRFMADVHEIFNALEQAQEDDE